MATTIIGSLAINPLLPIQSRIAGQISWGPFAVPAGYTFLTVQIDLQQVASLTAVFSATGFIAPDGVNFQSIGGPELDLSRTGFRLVNGVLMRSDGTVPLPPPNSPPGFFEADPMGPGPVRTFGFRFPLSQCDLTTRKVQGTLSCTEAVISGATLVAF
jgi:hypothetical protein